ncbi:hypothetical protein LCGC14_2926470, partial [marine sediment metagenome]
MLEHGPGNGVPAEEPGAVLLRRQPQSDSLAGEADDREARDA